MKRTRTPRTLLTLLAFATLGLGVAHAETDRYAGTECHQMWTSSPVVQRDGGTLYNANWSSAAWVSCPLSMDDSDSRYYKYTYVNVKDAQTTTDISCRRVTPLRTGGAFFGANVDSGTFNTGPRTLSLGATLKGYANSVSCHLPSADSSGSHFIYEYSGIKN